MRTRCSRRPARDAAAAAAERDEAKAALGVAETMATNADARSDNLNSLLQDAAAKKEAAETELKESKAKLEEAVARAAAAEEAKEAALADVNDSSRALATELENVRAEAPGRDADVGGVQG